MDFADEAFFAKRNGQEELAKEYFEKAYQAEKRAAEQVDDPLLEPTRSVLFRSAATLAFDCGKVEEAERLVLRALLGDPPPEIESELKALFEKTQFKEHISLHGVALNAGELQLTLVGRAIGEGMAYLKEVVARLQDIEKLVYRTKARVRNQDFSRRLILPSLHGLYMSVPRTGSFSVTLKVGEEDILPLPNFDDSHDVVGEFMDCMELLQNKRFDLLRERIEVPQYFQNFVGLAKKIAPDGEDITMVGLTVLRGANERSVSFSCHRHEIPDFTQVEVHSSEFELGDNPTTVSGVLRYADALRHDHEVKLAVPEGRPWKILVPEGLMEDIVTPHWGKPVKVRGYKVKRKQKTLYLTDILETQDSSQLH